MAFANIFLISRYMHRIYGVGIIFEFVCDSFIFDSLISMFNET